MATNKTFWWCVCITLQLSLNSLLVALGGGPTKAESSENAKCQIFKNYLNKCFCNVSQTSLFIPDRFKFKLGAKNKINSSAIVYTNASNDIDISSYWTSINNVQRKTKDDYGQEFGDCAGSELGGAGIEGFFKLKVHEPDCNDNDTRYINLRYYKDEFHFDYFLVRNKTKVKKTKTNKNLRKIGGNSENDNMFSRDGYFKMGKKMFVSPHSYCISRITTNTITVKTCLPNSQKQNQNYTTMAMAVIRKCCPIGSVVNLDVQNLAATATHEINCIEVGMTMNQFQGELVSEQWSPYLYQKISKNGKLTFQKIESQSQFQKLSRLNYVQKFHKCKAIKIFTPNARAYAPERAEIRVVESGHIYTRTSGNHDWDVPRKNHREIQIFCIDGLLDSIPGVNKNSEKFTRTEENQILVYCSDLVHHHDITIISIIHLSMMGLAIIFLFIVFLVHVLVWDTQNIHGWTVATYSFSMLMFLIFKTIADIFRTFQKDKDAAVAFEIGSFSCIAIGVVLHYFYISMFSWMAIINYDLWSTMVAMTRKKGRAKKDKRRFKVFSAVGFGIPTIVVSVSLFIELYFGYFDDRVLRPQYGNTKCDLDKSARLFYEILVSMALFSFGIVLSCFTIKILVNYRRNARLLNEATKYNRRYNLAQLFTKIFVLLAFSWTFEIIGIFWSILTNRPDRWHVILFDIHNFIQSVGFFWIFVCNSEIQQQLRLKFTVVEGIVSWLGRAFKRGSEPAVAGTSFTAIEVA